ASSNTNSANRLVRLVSLWADLDLFTERPQSIQKLRSRGIKADAFDLNFGFVQQRGRGDKERSRRKHSGHSDISGGKTRWTSYGTSPKFVLVAVAAKFNRRT